jgi:hypothetical protein
VAGALRLVEATVELAQWCLGEVDDLDGGVDRHQTSAFSHA